CDGASTTCADAKAAVTVICRPSTGECDATETCSGTADACPPDQRGAPGTPCTDDGLPCTTDLCSATGSACEHLPGNRGNVCRAATGGVRDSAESRDRTADALPA